MAKQAKSTFFDFTASSIDNIWKNLIKSTTGGEKSDVGWKQSLAKSSAIHGRRNNYFDGKKFESLEFKSEASSLMYYSSISAFLGAIGIGLGIGWTAPSLDCMSFNDTSPHYVLPQDADLVSWIVSSLTFGACFGALISGVIIEFFGRKYCLIFYGAPFTIGWLIILIGTDGALIAGRTIIGFAIGALSGTAPGYVIDVSTKDVRGFLCGIFQFMVATGILLAFTIGAYWDWRVSTVFMVIPTIFMSQQMFFMPEGPNWLISKGRYKEAEENLRKLRSENSEIGKELNAMVYCCEIFNEQECCGLRQTKPLVLAIILMILQQASGTYLVNFYCTGILRQGGSHFEPNTGTVIFGFAQWVSTMVSSSLMDFLDRKYMLMLSGIINSFCLSVLATFLAFHDPESPELVVIPNIVLIMFAIGSSLGWGPVPWTMVFEITPHKSSTSIALFTSWFTAFVVSKTFYSLQDICDLYGVFYVYACLSSISPIIIFYLMPETRKKSCHSVQKVLFDNEEDDLVLMAKSSVISGFKSSIGLGPNYLKR